MRGTIVKHTPKQGKPTFGYYFVAGRDQNNKRVQIKRRGFAKKTDAEKALKKAIEEFERKPARERVNLTFAEFFERWYSQKQRHCAPKTVERYYQLGQYAVRTFGGILLTELDTMGLANSMDQLSDHGGQQSKQHPKGKPLAPKTVRHIAFLVQDCLELAVDWDLIAKNPMRKVKKPKVPRRRPAIVSSDGFINLFRKIRGRRIYPIVLVYASTGMRRGEVLALEWTDLDWDTGMLEVSKSLEQTKAGLRIKGTKSGETRRIALSAAVVDALREHQRTQDRDRELHRADYGDLGLIFARPDGYYYSPDKLGTRVRAAMVEAGLAGVSLHSLRHTHASELLSKGAPIPAVAERLGHASANVTLSIYSHTLPTDNLAVAKLWNDAIVNVLEESRKPIGDETSSGSLPKSTKSAAQKQLTLVKSTA
jgi:integrase